ncbi:hypothetical protein LLG96_02330 [bacterium]|nr:hypothetical protein [bacterium]
MKIPSQFNVEAKIAHVQSNSTAAVNGGTMKNGVPQGLRQRNGKVLRAGAPHLLTTKPGIPDIVTYTPGGDKVTIPSPGKTGSGFDSYY